MSVDLIDKLNPDLTDERLSVIEGSYGQEVDALVAELRLMREIFCDDFSNFMETDDDPEEWQRWVYRSGKPSWFKLPKWFIDEHPWMAPENQS